MAVIKASVRVAEVELDVIEVALEFLADVISPLLFPSLAPVEDGAAEESVVVIVCGPSRP